MRTVDSVSFGGTSFPPKGKYQCKVIALSKGKSPSKKTPFIELTLTTGEDDFSDQLYITDKAIGRLCLVARRVCDMPDTFEIPDNDNEAVNLIAKFICENALEKECIVTIEENEESFIPTSGPDIGRTKTILKRRVAFRGYDRYISSQISDTSNSNIEEEDLPF